MEVELEMALSCLIWVQGIKFISGRSMCADLAQLFFFKKGKVRR